MLSLSRSLLLAAVAIVIGSVSAVAASLTPSAPTQTWTGWYAGLNAGADWGNENVSWLAASSRGGFNVQGANDINISSPGSVRTLGFTGGGQVGYNFQFDSLVVGGEADFAYTGIDGSRTLLSSIFQNSYTQSVQSNWLGTFRGRLGIANGPWLFYGTGGLAVAQVNFTDNFLGLHGVGPINSSVSDTRFGWTVGAGAELAIAQEWSVKLEYLHVDLGSETDVGASLVNAATINHMHSLTEDIAKIGVNYRWAARSFVTK